MNSRGDPSDRSITSILLAITVPGLPALAALTLIGIAALTLDGWRATIAVVCAVAGMFAGDALLARTRSGAAHRGARDRLLATLDVEEMKARDISRYGPIAVGFLCLLVADPGLAALTLVVAFPIGQLAFAIWLYGRRDEFSQAPES